MPAGDIRQLEERFKRELKLARQVTHPNVVRIHDLAEVGRTLYLTMEYVQGADLATVLQRDGRLPLGRALSLARQIVAGLGAAHRAGVVHRDLKPANIMVDADDHALLTDFGIARSTTALTVHTMPGAIIGTLDYMAPEQARGEPADERTDVNELGLILYELLAGPRPRPANEKLRTIQEDISIELTQGTFLTSSDRGHSLFDSCGHRAYTRDPLRSTDNGGVMKRNFVFGVLTCVLVTAMAVRMQGRQHGPGGNGNGTAGGSDDSKIQIGYRIAPVPLNLKGKNPALVGLGSYIVNAQADCAGCHSNPQYAPGGDPHFGEPELSDPSGHLRGGLQLFGPLVVPRNLTPNAAGLPAGLTLDQFLEVFSIGTDFDNAPPVVPGPDSPDLLQVMPWPVFSKMTDREKRAIYEYLRAIPCLPAGSGRCT